MKLVKPVESQATPISMGSFKGHLKLNTCVIDFGTEAIVLGKKIDMLKFGNVVYRGVVPLKRDKTTVECVVEQTEQQQ